MNFGIAFNETIRKFSIKAITLSENAGVSTGVISRFRSGFKAVNTDSLEKLLMALDDDAFRYFLMQLAEARGIHIALQEKIPTSELVGHLDDVETATLLHAVASKIRTDARTGVLTSA